MAIRKMLRARWTPEQTDAAVSYILGEPDVPPFGVTPDERVDLRGLSIKGFFRPQGISMENCDLSYCHIDHRLIFAESRILNVNCDDLEGTWGDFRSDFTNVTFRKAKMRGSSFGGEGSRYLSCNFDEADFSGSTGFEAAFVQCSFRDTKFADSVMGGCSFASCQFRGAIEGTIFGNRGNPVFEDCDFEDASFVDCAFNDTRFRSCKTGKHTLIYHDWARALRKFETKVADVTDASIIDDCELWIGVWESRLHITPENIIDLADLQKQLPRNSAKWIFDAFSTIHASQEPD